MIKEVEVNGKKYEVDTTPSCYHYAEIYGVIESPASGVVANVLRQIGKDPITKLLTKVSDSEMEIVVKTLGWKFSRSNAWKNLWELYRGRQRKRGQQID